MSDIEKLGDLLPGKFSPLKFRRVGPGSYLTEMKLLHGTVEVELQLPNQKIGFSGAISLNLLHLPYPAPHRELFRLYHPFVLGQHFKKMAYLNYDATDKGIAPEKIDRGRLGKIIDFMLVKLTPHFDLSNLSPDERKIVSKMLSRTKSRLAYRPRRVPRIATWKPRRFQNRKPRLKP